MKTKKRLYMPYLAALAVLACAVLLDGCQTITKVNFDFDASSIEKAQRIEISDAATGESLRVLETREEVDAFVEGVDVGGWALAEEPKDARREGAFTVCQQATVQALSGGGEERTVELFTLYSYRDAAYLTIGTPVLDITFSIPAKAAEYLHSLLT